MISIITKTHLPTTLPVYYEALPREATPRKNTKIKNSSVKPFLTYEATPRNASTYLA